MKIAIFHNLPSGGAKRALYNNVNYLTHNHTVDVFIPSTANEDYLPLKNVSNKLNIFPVKNTYYGYFKSLIKPYFLRKVSIIDLEKTQKHIAETINNGDYDVVYCEQDRFTMAPFFLKYIKKPVVYYCNQTINFRDQVYNVLYDNAGLRNKDKIGFIHSKLYGKQIVKHDKKYMNYSKYTATNSFFTRELILQNYGINSFVSYLGVDSNKFKRQDIPRENFVLSVGQCLPEKGFDFIIKSLSLIDKNLRPELIIVSDHGNELWKNYLENRANRLDVKLKILSMIDDNELISLYNKAKLLVYAPYLEPFGLVPLEAMSCGTPIVAVKEGGVRESVTHDVTGVLTERDEKSFARAIVGLIEDREKTIKFAENSRDTINKHWTLENSGERLFKHLTRAIENFK